MKIFITGIDGMLGSAIARLHRQQGDTVTGCDVWGFTHADNFCDIRNEGRLREMVAKEQPNRIYHCAAMLGVQNTEEYPQVCSQVNLRGTFNIAMAAKDVGANLVFLSSSEVYGIQRGPITEESPLLGDNVYALSKRLGEEHLRRCAEDINVTICRMFNCFGSNQVRQFFIPKIVARALANEELPIYGNPQNMRSYLLDEDAAKHIAAAAQYHAHSHKGFNIYNVAHPHTVTLGYVVDRVLLLTKSKSAKTVRVGTEYDDRHATRDVPNRVADITKLQTVSYHKPKSFLDSLSTAISQHHTTRKDWVYARNLI